VTAARRRIVGICLNIDGTGLTRVMRTVMCHLAADFDVDFLGIGYSGPLIDDRGVRMHPTNPHGGDVFGAFQALAMVQRHPPDVVFVLHDLWLFDNYRRVFEPIRNQTKFVGYIPLDGAIVHERIALPLHALNRAVVYTDWAAGQLSGAFARLRAAGHTERLPPIDVVHHGVDTTIFAARPELLAADFDCRGRRDIKRRVFPTLDDPEHNFVVLNASRPAIRKRVDVTIQAFARFARDKPPGVRLCLHHAVTDEDTAQLLELACALGIGDRLLYNPLSPHGGALGEEDLARLYSACDLGINTAMGEGWGLVSFEHAATGAAQIVPRHSACAALWHDGIAQMVEPVARGIPPFSPLEMAAVDAEGAAAAMEALYADRDRLRRLSRAGHDHARRPEFTWESIADRWRGILADVITEAAAGT
jgi:glycosyltransferase involved in cell wall biosynthesis